MKKRLIAAVVILAISLSCYWMGFSLGKEKEEVYKELDIFAEALAVIDKKYTEEKKPQELIYGALTGLLASLDSYSEFLTPEEYKDLLIETEGRFGGVGLEITLKDGLLTVVSPLEDTPASHAGIKPGDVVVKIDGQLTKNITLHEAVKKMRGAPGTSVTLTILREKNKKVEDITLIRGIIKIKDITRAQLLEEGIGYIKIAEFREKTSKDLAAALLTLKQAGLRGLILDVRNNPGGLLDSAVEVASLFLDEGKVIVSTRSRGEKEEIYRGAKDAQKYLDIPIAVLISKGSASGSEIVAAALREHSRAILIGETTFGKGSVQSVIPLSDNSALRLTTARYYTPKGNSIHEKGVAPDVAVSEEENNNNQKKDAAVFEKLENKEDKFDYKKDNTITKALDLLKGVLVFSSVDQTK
ncbi:MAG: S41 family peptidase [Candidatus Omnitrophica bacterium]|nr:S41 family peptidase [Candidatus Omnitrophota bacterium]